MSIYVPGAKERDEILHRLPGTDGLDRHRLLEDDMGTTEQSDYHAYRPRRKRGGKVYGVYPALGDHRLSSVVRRFSSYSEEEGNQREICHFHAPFECKRYGEKHDGKFF